MNFLLQNNFFFPLILTLLGGLYFMYGRWGKKSHRYYYSKINHIVKRTTGKPFRQEKALKKLHLCIKRDARYFRLNPTEYSLLNEQLIDLRNAARKEIFMQESSSLSSSLITTLLEMIDDGVISDHEFESFHKLLEEIQDLTKEQKQKWISLLQGWKDDSLV